MLKHQLEEGLKKALPNINSKDIDVSSLVVLHISFHGKKVLSL